MIANIDQHGRGSNTSQFNHTVYIMFCHQSSPAVFLTSSVRFHVSAVAGHSSVCVCSSNSVLCCVWFTCVVRCVVALCVVYWRKRGRVTLNSILHAAARGSIVTGTRLPWETRFMVWMHLLSRDLSPTRTSSQ